MAKDSEPETPGNPAGGALSRQGSEPLIHDPDANRRLVNRSLEEQLGLFELPLEVIDLEDFTIKALSEVTAQRLGLEADSVIGKPFTSLLNDEYRQPATAALIAIRDGAIDYYRATRLLRSKDLHGVPVTAWARVIEIDDTRWALVELSFDTDVDESPVTEYFGRLPVTMAFGIADPSWVITAISSEVQELLGISASSMIGRQLLGALEQGSVHQILDAERIVSQEYSVARRVQFRNSSGEWTPLCCVLTSLVGTSGRCFILLPDEVNERAGEDRTAALEQHLLKIAAEVDASGVLQRVGRSPEFAHFPQLSGLSARQWEVLSHLMRGERVAQIADRMFISQSTVRNHLAAIYQRFGVHSQAELLALLSHK